MIETGKPETALGATHPAQPVECDLAESRVDPLTGNWTIFAPDRGQRPGEFVDRREAVNHNLQCPFCPGNEQITPPPVWVGRLSEEDNPQITTASAAAGLAAASSLDGDNEWAVRVVPNKFPAVQSLAHGESSGRRSGLLPRSPVVGAHEVIIESRQHVQSLSELDLSELILAFRAYRDRLRYWRCVDQIGYISLFKNVGSRAGASLRHTHSQLIATQEIPPAVSDTLDRMTRHRATTGCCLQCDLIRAELKAKRRMIWNDGSLVAFCPFASQLPMLLRVTTLNHQACFEDLDDPTIDSVARIIGRAVRWIEMVRPAASYNFCLRTCPPAAGGNPDAYHWSIDLFPRLTYVAGFEWSSQCMINPVLPESAASKYRACVQKEDPRQL